MKKVTKFSNEFDRLQDTKLLYRNLLHFYTLTMSYQKEKLRKQSTYNHIRKNKIPRNRLA